MLPQPQRATYHDGLNTNLRDAVPSTAKKVLDVGCARGRLGAELKQAMPGRYVAGVEVDHTAAAAAAAVLDDVFVVDAEDDLPPIEPGSLDCIVFGDVLEHLRNPEAVLRRYRDLLADDGSVVVSVPNVQHASVVKAILRGDFMYQPEGILDSTHLRFFTHMSFMKLMLDAGYLPRIVHRVPSGVAPEIAARATPLLQLYGVDPAAAIEPLDTFQYIFEGRPLDFPAERFADTKISFVVCSNDHDQLESNLARSPCFDPGSPHELIVLRNQTSAAAGYHAGWEQATGELVVFVHQDVYLPRGWDSRVVEQFAAAEDRFGAVGVAGVFGFRIDGENRSDAGRILDRQTLLEPATALPASVTGLDEVVLVTRRHSELRFDPGLGFHLYGADIALSALAAGTTVAVLDAPCLHNSLFHQLPPAFHEARRRMLERWPDVRPLYGSMGRLDGMVEQPVVETWFDRHEAVVRELAEVSARNEQLQHRIDSLEAELADRRQHIRNMESSVFWRARGGVNRLLRRADLVRRG
jgi:SAM-dependent methyltransferase